MHQLVRFDGHSSSDRNRLIQMHNRVNRINGKNGTR
jgi:hypothetical protein